MNDLNHKPGRRERIFGALIVAVLIGIIIFLLLRAPAVETPSSLPTSGPVAPVDRAAPPKLPVAFLPLDRAQLLAAATAAADAVASDRELPRQNAALVGRTFLIHLPFGCDGPLTDPASQWAGWTYNSRTRALKLSARPEIWDEAPWVRALAGDMRFEAAEGFWIRRPWSSAESCLIGADEEPVLEGDAAAAERQTVGIVQFFAPDSPRTLRRGSRPYAVTTRTDEEIGTGPREYRLMIKGRIEGFPDGQPVHCRTQARDLRPICLIAVQFGSVAFENPRDGHILSEWQR